VIGVPELETERLLLRGWRPADLEPFAQMNADPEVMRLLPAPLKRRQSDALAQRCMRGLERDGVGPWALEERATGRFLGFTGLARPRFEAPFLPAVEIGWRLARDAWGQGFASEGARAAAAYAFGTLGLDELVAFTTPQNARSRGVMERLGMTRDPADDFEHPALPEGHPLRHHVLYRLRSSGTG
jgi:RimJ/RimL family protein N-acetyltransferase